MLPAGVQILGKIWIFFHKESCREYSLLYNSVIYILFWWKVYVLQEIKHWYLKNIFEFSEFFPSLPYTDSDNNGNSFMQGESTYDSVTIPFTFHTPICNLWIPWNHHFTEHKMTWVVKYTRSWSQEINTSWVNILFTQIVYFSNQSSWTLHIITTVHVPIFYTSFLPFQFLNNNYFQF